MTSTILEFGRVVEGLWKDCFPRSASVHAVVEGLEGLLVKNPYTCARARTRATFKYIILPILPLIIKSTAYGITILPFILPHPSNLVPTSKKTELP
jgi:hypothetical protein